MTDPSIRRRGNSASLGDRAFPTRRAIIGGAVIAGVVTALSYRPSPDRPWILLSEKAPWSPRDGAALLVHDDRLWLFGGSASDHDLSDCWSSVDGVDWRMEVDRAAWTLSSQSMSVSFAGRMWRMGGFVKREGRFVTIGEIWSSIDGRTWTLAATAPAWKPRGGGVLIVYEGKLWLLGGTQHPRNEGSQPALNDVWSTENGIDWRKETASAPWQPRSFHSVIAHNGRLWLIGGGLWDKEPNFYRDVWSSSDGINWKEHTNKAAWSGRIWATAASYQGLLWTMGGLVATPRGGVNDLWYSDDGRDWYPYLAKRPWPPRLGHSSIVFNNRLWVLAGSDSNYYSDVWALRIGKDEVFPGSGLTRAQKWLYRNLQGHYQN